jgi:transcription antitermination factor NusG
MRQGEGNRAGAKTEVILVHRWYALRVKSRCEKSVALVARNKGFEEFVPLYCSRRRWSDRSKPVEIPLFPGYVFCRLNAENRLPLLTIPGVLHLVGFGKTPMPLEDSEIEVIRSAVRAGVPVEPWPFLETGQRVQIAAGPLTGCDGILMRSQNLDRVVVSLTVLRKSVAVEIERHWLVPEPVREAAVSLH